MPKNFNNKLADKNYIAEVGQAFLDIETKYPIALQFLEEYCGFTTPVLSTDPHEIAYAGGKRDVILTLKTLMRRDIDPAQIALFYKNNL